MPHPAGRGLPWSTGRRVDELCQRRPTEARREAQRAREMKLDEAAQSFREFVTVVQALRTPETGCPWDLEQDHQSLRPYLLEEAQEVLDAIAQGNDGSLQEELGDLLLQVVL